MIESVRIIDPRSPLRRTQETSHETLEQRFAVVLAFVPLVASAQFKDLDAAMSNL